MANSGEVIMSSVGMKIHCLQRQSMTTKIVVCLEEAESCSMKFIEIEFLNFKEIRSCFRSSYGLCLETFVHTQVVHEKMYSFMKVHTPSQVCLQHISSKVQLCPKCLKIG